MEELQKSIRVNKLLDIYGALLTKHQEEVLELYYQMDLSLSEISEQLGISRNGVYDAIKKATALLEKYEEKLLLLSKEEELDVFFEEVKKNKNQSELELISYIESKVK
jgi:predicted DNA-binding protein YlxM (UPF0122 family)